MFGRENNRERLRIDAYNGDGTRVQGCAVCEYRLPETVVLNLSMEYFGDPEPCEIHRAAVQKRAMMELIEFCGLDRRISVADLPEVLRRCFPAEICELCIRRCGT